MKILFVHNSYDSRLPSGENVIIQQEIESLLRHGEEISYFNISNDLILKGKFHLARRVVFALNPIIGLKFAKEFKILCKNFKPDVVHIHNLYPLLSPRLITIAKKLNLPVVMTLHNYRLGCINGLLFRRGNHCDDCLIGKPAYLSIVHRCYRNSFLQSAVMYFSQRSHKRAWEKVTLYICPTPFMKRFLTNLGIDQSKIVLKPNWALRSHNQLEANNLDCLYLGRLEESKGLKLVIEGWMKRQNPQSGKLKIAGKGPMMEVILEACLKDTGIEYLGNLDSAAAREMVSGAGVVLIPSLLTEVFPVALVEAFESARPVAISTKTSASQICTPKDSWLIEPTVEAWRDFFSNLNLQEIREKGNFARTRFKKEFSEDTNYRNLMASYYSALEINDGINY
jgi:glycosyltransferase involved in cell wall biosynthesis